MIVDVKTENDPKDKGIWSTLDFYYAHQNLHCGIDSTDKSYRRVQCLKS